MSRPLVVTDCDEVLLHMVRHFRDWLADSHGIEFRSTATLSPRCAPRHAEPMADAEIWRFLRAFFDTEMHRQTAIEGAVDGVAELSARPTWSC